MKELDFETAITSKRRGHSALAARRRAYVRGFLTEAKKIRLVPGPVHAPYSVEDDPTLSPDDAFHMGRADALAAKGKTR